MAPSRADSIGTIGTSIGIRGQLHRTARSTLANLTVDRCVISAQALGILRTSLGIPRSRSRSTFRLVHGRPVLLAHSARARSAWLLCPHGRPSDSARLTVAPILDRQHRDVSDRPWQVTVDLRFSPRWTVGQSHPSQTFAQPDAHMLRSTFTILQGGPVPPQIFCLGHKQPTVNRWKNPRLTGELFFTQFPSFCSHSHIAPTKFTHPCTY